jgi:hypothetical protein
MTWAYSSPSLWHRETRSRDIQEAGVIVPTMKGAKRFRRGVTLRFRTVKRDTMTISKYRRYAAECLLMISRWHQRCAK